MSVISDVQTLFGTVRNTWAKSQAHVLAHVIVLLLIFAVCRATVPEVRLPAINAKQIADNDWFKLAKDTGLIYVSFVLPFVVAAAYLAVLRAVGQFLVAMIMLLFPPSQRSGGLRLLSSWSLEPLALTLNKKEFEFNDLFNKSSQLSVKYQSKKNEFWEGYQKSLSGLTKNSQVYLGDFLIFIVMWILLFNAFPQSAWVQQNSNKFWPVLVLLSGLAWFAWFRVSRAMTVLPSLMMMYVSTILPADPDMTAVISASTEEREAVRQRLDEVLKEERERAMRLPSLRSILFRGKSDAASERRIPRPGLPFRRLYERGYRFSWDTEKMKEMGSGGLADYVSYFYYRVYDRLRTLGRSLWQLARYVVTGAP